MGGGRGGVLREVREHSSVALAAVYFLSFPIPLLRLCWGKIKMFAIFVSLTRFYCPLPIHYHFRVIHNNFLYLAPTVSPPCPYCPSPPPFPTNLPFRKLSVVKFHWMALQMATEIKKMPINFFSSLFLMKDRRSRRGSNENQRALGASSFMLWLRFAVLGLAEYRYSWIRYVSF